MKKILTEAQVLGVTYTVSSGTTLDYPDLCDCDGYCDTTVKQIVVFDPLEAEGRPGAKADMQHYQRKVIRHELIHAILFESGLASNSWGGNEELVDWIAIQHPKLISLFRSAGCED